MIEIGRTTSTETDMKKYALFAGERYHPLGGWEDFQGDFDTVQEAKNIILTEAGVKNWTWAHIVNLQDRRYLAIDEGWENNQPGKIPIQDLLNVDWS